MQDRIRWGVLAPGSIAHKFAEGLRALPDATLTAVGSRSRERAETFARKFGATRVWGSYEELVRDPEVDAIYVSSPHTRHAEHTLLALGQGKAVLCEKPFAVNARQARTMVEAARRAGVFLMEAMWTRFLPSMVELRKLLAEGVIGEPRMVLADFAFRCDGNPASRLMSPALGGGGLLDVGIYPISLAYMLFGAPEAVTGFAAIGATGVDEQASAVMRHPGGRIATCTFGVRTSSPHAGLVLGTEGSIDLGRGWWSGKELVINTSAGARTVDPARVGNGYNYEAAELGRCLGAGLAESPVLPLDESVRIMETLDELRRQWGLKYPGE